MKNTEYITNNLKCMVFCFFSLMFLCSIVQEVNAKDTDTTSEEIRVLLDSIAKELDYDLSKKTIAIQVDNNVNDDLPTITTKPVIGEQHQAIILVNKANWEKKNDLDKTVLVAHELERVMTVSDPTSNVNKAFENKLDAHEKYIKARIDNEPKIDMLRKQKGFYEAKLDYLKEVKQDEINAYYKYSESHRIKLSEIVGLPETTKGKLDLKVIKDKVKTTKRNDVKIENTKFNLNNSRKDLVQELKSLRNVEDKKLSELNRLNTLRQISQKNYTMNAGEVQGKIAKINKEIDDNS